MVDLGIYLTAKTPHITSSVTSQTQPEKITDFSLVVSAHIPLSHICVCARIHTAMHGHRHTHEDVCVHTDVFLHEQYLCVCSCTCEP